jgi:hypothetical protein
MIAVLELNYRKHFLNLFFSERHKTIRQLLLRLQRNTIKINPVLHQGSLEK